MLKPEDKIQQPLTVSNPEGEVELFRKMRECLSQIPAESVQCHLVLVVNKDEDGDHCILKTVGGTVGDQRKMAEIVIQHLEQLQAVLKEHNERSIQ